LGASPKGDFIASTTPSSVDVAFWNIGAVQVKKNTGNINLKEFNFPS